MQTWATRLFDASSTTIASLDDHLARHDNPVVPLSFAEGAGERFFTDEDAVLAHALANLPNQGRLPIAFVPGELSGADLALALFCPMLAIGADAQLSTGFGRPASAAVYVASARRLGAVACERLLFGPKSACAAEAGAAHLGERVASPSDVLALGTNRLATMLSVARANLVTWPMPLAKMRALVDVP